MARRLLLLCRVVRADRHAYAVELDHLRAATATQADLVLDEAEAAAAPLRTLDTDTDGVHRRRGVHTVIPQPSDQTANRKRRGSAGGRPPVFDRDACKQRNTVERCINRLKQWRGPVTRYDKTATIYLAALHIAGIFIWSTR